MDQTNPPQFKTVSGRWVVLAVLAFGIIVTGTLWIYSKLELAPFLPLRRALYAEFPKSKPRVEGGRPRRMPPVLRVVMQVDFPPTQGDERVEKIVERVIALAKEHVDLARFENFELHIVYYAPEKRPERITIERKIREL